MCRELEIAGLQNPEYHVNAFLLQTIIYNGNAKKLAIGTQKLAIEILKLAIEKKKYHEPTKENIIQVYEEIEVNQIFGAADVVGILNCAPSTARNIMLKLRDMDVLKEVKGKGKGRYRFAYEEENL